MSGLNLPTALTERGIGGAVCTMETTGADGLGPGTKGALEGLVNTGTGDLSLLLTVAVFSVSVLGTIIGDAEVQVADASLSDCWEPLEDVVLTWALSMIALV